MARPQASGLFSRLTYLLRGIIPCSSLRGHKHGHLGGICWGLITLGKGGVSNGVEGGVQLRKHLLPPPPHKPSSSLQWWPARPGGPGLAPAGPEEVREEGPSYQLLTPAPAGLRERSSAERFGLSVKLFWDTATPIC